MAAFFHGTDNAAGFDAECGAGDGCPMCYGGCVGECAVFDVAIPARCEPVAEVPAVTASEILNQFRAANDALAAWRDGYERAACSAFKLLQVAGERAIESGTAIDVDAIMATLPGTAPTLADFLQFIGDQGFEIGYYSGGGIEPRVFTQASDGETFDLAMAWESR